MPLSVGEPGVPLPLATPAASQFEANAALHGAAESAGLSVSPGGADFLPHPAIVLGLLSCLRPCPWTKP